MKVSKKKVFKTFKPEVFFFWNTCEDFQKETALKTENQVSMLISAVENQFFSNMGAILFIT